MLLRLNYQGLIYPYPSVEYEQPSFWGVLMEPADYKQIAARLEG